jgi:hypothetical protein
MKNFEKITAQTILNRLSILDKEIDQLTYYKIETTRLVAKQSELYLLAALLFNINNCMDLNNSIATNYYEIEKELKLIAQ